MQFSTNTSAIAIRNDYGQPAGKFWLEIMPFFLKCASKESKEEKTVLVQNDDGEKLSLGGGTAEIVIIALACCVGLLCIVLVVTCICFKSKRKEHTTYNAIEM